MANPSWCERFGCITRHLMPAKVVETGNGQVGAAVNASCRRRWSYIHGSSRRRLPRLPTSLESIGLLLYDSIHSDYNPLFELEQAWSVLRPSGVLVADDIDLNNGFHSFVQVHSGHPFFVCRSRPLPSDPSRLERCRTVRYFAESSAWSSKPVSRHWHGPFQQATQFETNRVA